MKLKATVSLLSVLAVFSTFFVGDCCAQEEIYLELTGGGINRVALAAPPFNVGQDVPREAASVFQSVLDADVEAAPCIKLVDRKLYALVEPDPRPEVLNQRWRAIGAQFLLTGTVSRAGGQLVVEARMVDLISGEYAMAKRYRAPLSASRALAHTLANELVKVFTGRSGPFLSSIVFVSDRTGKPELWIMEWDGYGQRQVTKHNSYAIGPTWGPKGELIAFSSFLRGFPALYLLKPKEGYLKLLWDKGGVNSSPSFSPDGKKIAFASSQGGNVDIWVLELETGEARRLTTAAAIDTQPCWAPNGRQIVFTSTRSGSPQLYLMDADGSNVRRLTMEGEYFDEASFSPDGLKVVATTKVDGRFQLCTVDVATGQVKIIPGPGNNENPAFSPDGSMIVFVSDRSGNPQIYVTDAEGRPRQLTSEGRNYAPSWAPAPN